jgi:hypothetical protein
MFVKQKLVVAKNKFDLEEYPLKSGKLHLKPDAKALIVRIAGDNPCMGYDKIHGVSLKLGFRVDPSTVKNVLRPHGVLPTPQQGCSSWPTCLKH